MLEKQINETVEYIRSKIGTVPEAAIVLGSGLGGFADQHADAIIGQMSFCIFHCLSPCRANRR